MKSSLFKVIIFGVVVAALAGCSKDPMSDPANQPHLNKIPGAEDADKVAPAAVPANPDAPKAVSPNNLIH